MTSPFFIFYRQGTLQKYGAYGGEYMDDWIHLSLSRRDLLMLQELQIPFDLPVSVPDLDELSELVRFITYEFHAARSLRCANLSLYLRLLFNRIGGHFHTAHPNPHFSVLNRIRGMMYNEPGREYRIDTMAGEAGLSRSAFQHIYKEIFGISVNRDRIQARTGYAMGFLDSTALPVYQIAEMCGYHSDIHFMRQFKAQTGLTPSQYRRREREK